MNILMKNLFFMLVCLSIGLFFLDKYIINKDYYCLMSLRENQSIRNFKRDVVKTCGCNAWDMYQDTIGETDLDSCGRDVFQEMTDKQFETMIITKE